MRTLAGRPAARKRFGQHFLEPPWVNKVVRSIEAGPDDVFIEIGPGRGALTVPLAARAEAVVAYEIDRDLADTLRTSLPVNVRVVARDFLRVTAADVMEELVASGLNDAAHLRVAGNLPYNAASPILFHLLGLFRSGIPLVDAVVMVQREVADRLLARPGNRDYGVLSILIRQQADLERLLDLPAGAFRPAPKVRSTLVRLRFHEPRPAVAEQDVFSKLTRAIFTQRRKTLANALRAYSTGPPAPANALALAGIDGSRRPESLDLIELASLADVYARGRE